MLPYAGKGAGVRREQEFAELAKSAGAEILGRLRARAETPNPKFFIGTGKADEAQALVRELGIDLVLVDHALTPVQERNLEAHLSARVIDRAALILDIFAQRAQSHEGKLEVELAQLQYIATRLVRGWTHLERQRGGSIGLRGPGETQLETDRRLLQKRVEQLQKRIEKVAVQRTQQRRARLRNTVSRLALVGYTNAGKSTLFNAVTRGAVYTADQLFATLDPTVRRLDGLEAGPAVLADTVGFIRELPHDLVAAFRATLSEARDADLLLHVIDAADPERDVLERVVNGVLDEIGAGDVPQLKVFNKIDMLPGRAASAGNTERTGADGESLRERRMGSVAPRIDRDAEGAPDAVWLSAASGAGLDLLCQAVGERLAGSRVRAELRLPPRAGRLRARLIELGAVRGEHYDQDGWRLDIDAPRELLLPLAGDVRGEDARLLRELCERP